jgi:hypothetical protein
MTPRERVLAVLRGEPADKVPFTTYQVFLPQCAVERRLREEGMCIVNRSVPAYTIETPDCITESHTYTEHGRPRERTVIRTPVGEVSSVVEPTENTRWHVERLFKGPKDYEVLRYIAGNERCRPTYDEYLAGEKWLGEDVILRSNVGLSPLHEIMIMWMGVETFAVEWAERRDEILKLEKVMREKRRERYRVLADAPISHANYGGNEVPEVMGLERFREFCIPLHNECAEMFNAKGKLLGVHLDGNNRLWARDVARSGLHYIEAFTPAPDTDMTLAEALEAWPDKVLWINFPSSVHLRSIERIKQTTRELIEAASGTGRLIIGITEDVPLDRWQENFLAISDVINNG